MKRFTLSFGKMIVAACLLMGLQASSRAQAAHGGAIANGTVAMPSGSLNVISNQSCYNGVYFGYVSLQGRVNGQVVNTYSVYVTHANFFPSGDNFMVTAWGNTTYKDARAMLAFTWDQCAHIPSCIGFKITAYKDGDADGAPTGDILLASGANKDGAMIPVNGQVRVKLPAAK